MPILQVLTPDGCLAPAGGGHAGDPDVCVVASSDESLIGGSHTRPAASGGRIGSRLEARQQPKQERADFFPCHRRILGIGDVEASFGQSTHHDERERSQRLGINMALESRPAQHTPQRNGAKPRFHFPHAFPTENGACVSHHDSLYRRVQMCIDPEIAAHEKGLPRIGTQEFRHDEVGHLPLDHFVHRREQILLAGEVVVQSPLRDPGLGDDIIERGLGEATSAEQIA